MTTLSQSIAAAIAGTEPQSKARRKALSLVKWRLRSGLLYAGTDRALQAVLVGPDEAIVFDGRDNEQVKADFWKATTGRTFKVELL
jgi:hypothetical protein